MRSRPGICATSAAVTDMSARKSQSEAMLTPVGAGPVVRRTLLTLVLVLTAFFLLAPLALIFSSALSQGLPIFFKNLTDPAIAYAIWLTLVTALVVVPINVVFGLAAAWTVTKFDFPGRTLL